MNFKPIRRACNFTICNCNFTTELRGKFSRKPTTIFHSVGKGEARWRGRGPPGRQTSRRPYKPTARCVRAGVPVHWENKRLVLHINWCLVSNVQKLNTCWCRADLNVYWCALALHLWKRLVNCTPCGVQFLEVPHCNRMPRVCVQVCTCVHVTKRLVTRHYVMSSCVSTPYNVQSHQFDT